MAFSATFCSNPALLNDESPKAEFAAGESALKPPTVDLPIRESKLGPNSCDSTGKSSDMITSDFRPGNSPIASMMKRKAVIVGEKLYEKVERERVPSSIRLPTGGKI